MITDPRVFEDEHLPRELMHREGAVETLLRAWEHTCVGEAGDEVIIAGPSGVGKTALARHTLRRLADQTRIDQAYVGCLGATPATILRNLCAALDTQPAGNASTVALQARVVEAVERPTIVVLDEADDLPGSSGLELLAGIPQLSTVVITHDLNHWLARATDTHDRYMGARHLTLDRYGVSELADILAARARAGLPSGTVEREQLERIADAVAGVAREGIQVLRAAATVATERGHETISTADIDDAFQRARHRIRQSNLRSLPFHHHILYAILFESGPLDGAALHDRYESVAEQAYAGRQLTPIGKRSRRNKLQKLMAYDLVAREGPEQAPVYVVVDDGVKPAFRRPCEA